MSGEGVLGVVLVVGCAAYTLYSVVETRSFMAASERTTAVVTSAGSGVGVPEVQAEYTLRDGKKRVVTLETTRKSGSKKLTPGDRVVVYHHLESGELRKGGFLSLWFNAILSGFGIALGAVFIVRARKNA